MIVLHYTGMPDAEGALDRLTSPEAKVSAHYLRRRGRHGLSGWSTRTSAPGTPASRYWRGITDVNSASVGIEIVNPGHEFGYRAVSRRADRRADPAGRRHQGAPRHRPRQCRRPFATSPRRARRIPASCSRGRRCAKRRLALPSPTRDLIDPFWTDAGFLLALERFGYDVTDPQKAVIAFQRRFRPDLHRRRSSTANAGPNCSRSCCRGRNRPIWQRRQRAGRPRRELVAGEESPGSTERRCRVTPGGLRLRPAVRESATESRPPVFGRVRAKGCGKSAPRAWQRRRHGKPHRVQDRIGAAYGPVPARRPGWSLEAAGQPVVLEEWSPLPATLGEDRTRLTGPLAYFSSRRAPRNGRHERARLELQMTRQKRSDDWGFPRWRPYGAKGRDAVRVRLCDRVDCAACPYSDSFKRPLCSLLLWQDTEAHSSNLPGEVKGFE